eukprot:gene13833-7777_t
MDAQALGAIRLIALNQSAGTRGRRRPVARAAKRCRHGRAADEARAPHRTPHAIHK